MASFAPHRLLPIGVLVALLSGCASGSRTGEVETAEAPSEEPFSGPTVTSEDIERGLTDPIERVLMSRFPGVWVARTGDGGISVRIRGVSSVYGSNEPLYVIDGIALQPVPGGSLTGINPYDIETIKVLKNPVDTAMYGMRGANGVIVITTKRP
jgi:TonB-dependent SusC/RagA subfamily outer membrane receptor